VRGGGRRTNHSQRGGGGSWGEKRIRAPQKCLRGKTVRQPSFARTLNLSTAGPERRGKNEEKKRRPRGHLLKSLAARSGVGEGRYNWNLCAPASQTLRGEEEPESKKEGGGDGSESCGGALQACQDAEKRPAKYSRQDFFRN